MRVWIVACLLLAIRVGSARAQQAIIYDDDCSNDVDCVATLPILYGLEDLGEIRILAMVADSADPLTAPVMHVFAKYGGHPETVIGANQTGEPSTAFCAKTGCNASVWAKKLVERFDPGDGRSKYPDCVDVYRRTLAKQPDHTVSVVATGFATCLNQLLASRADALSPLGGAELVKRKVKLLSVMGGKYPAGAEWNFESDSRGYHKLFRQWTRQHGYPPVYLNGWANGARIRAGAPATASPKVNPTRYAMELAKTNQRPMWDVLSALVAARGLAYEGTTYFTLSNPGTVKVNAKTGADTWSSAKNSGHYVLRNAASNEKFAALLDGYAHSTGFLAKDTSPPQAMPTRSSGDSVARR